uniref:DUF5641 domain-containing protein n=1 Tax=Anopheles minimus TaxID=112268 RepID=A0A182W5C7_9DIPT
YQVRYRHCNHQTIINALRSRFYTPRLLSEYNRVRRNCHNRDAVPEPPLRLFRSNSCSYLEIAHSMTTSSCILAIRRFIARRGAPREIISDHGTNFLIEEFNSPALKWSFNHSAAPHVGGCWERPVQSVKKVLIQFSDLRATRRQASQCNADLFWRMWVSEYLPTLTRRTKCFTPARPIEEGKIVLIAENNLPGNCWPKGRVVAVVRANGWSGKASYDANSYRETCNADSGVGCSKTNYYKVK